MTIDASTPAICGAAQVIQRPGPIDEQRLGPIEIMVDAAHAAADDAGCPELLARVGWIAAVGGWWRYANPAQLVAERIGAPDASTALTAVSGSAPQEVVGLMAERVASGELDAALLVAGEARWTAQRLKRDGREPTWITEPGTGTPEPIGAFAPEMLAEMARLGAPATVYALLDDARRAALRRSVADHRDLIATLWADFSAVAASNPFAWDRSPHSVADVRDEHASNRMIAFPYTKAMVANNTVDMGSAILMCSVGLARELGLASDRLVFPHAVTKSHETWQVAERDELHRSSALAAAGALAYELAGVGPGDIEHIDLYACFPSIVQMSADALGLGFDRPLTVTGGLGFAGAPVGNAAGQAIAAMVPRLREGGLGLVHGNGGMATKHAIGIYASHPPADRFRYVDAQFRAELRPRRPAAIDSTGPVTVEAATVVHDRDGPSHVLAAVIDGDGSRSFVTSRDAAAVAATEHSGLAGLAGRRTHDAQLVL